MVILCKNGERFVCMYQEPPPSTSQMTSATWHLVREEVGVYKQKLLK